MGLAKKPKVVEQKPSSKLTQGEIEFILTKLRSADYKGTEFEMFFNVFNKLSQELQK